MPRPPVLPDAYDPPTAFVRWLGELVSYQNGADYAVVGVNVLPRQLSLIQIRTMRLWLEEIEKGMEREALGRAAVKSGVRPATPSRAT